MDSKALLRGSVPDIAGKVRANQGGVLGMRVSGLPRLHRGYGTARNHLHILNGCLHPQDHEGHRIPGDALLNITLAIKSRPCLLDSDTKDRYNYSVSDWEYSTFIARQLVLWAILLVRNAHTCP